MAMALALEATRPASALLPLAALAGIVALLLPNFAELRVLLTLDDFGAVGDGIADDTQISGNTVAPEDPDEWQGSDRDKWLHFYRVEDRSVSGGGFIDGRGQQWWARSCKGKHHENKKTQAVQVRKVEFVDIRGTSATKQAIKFACSDTVPCRELELKNVDLTLEGGGDASAFCYKASGKTAGAVVPASCLAKPDFVGRTPSPRMLRDAAADELDSRWLWNDTTTIWHRLPAFYLCKALLAHD